MASQTPHIRHSKRGMPFLAGRGSAYYTPEEREQLIAEIEELTAGKLNRNSLQYWSDSDLFSALQAIQAGELEEE